MHTDTHSYMHTYIHTSRIRIRVRIGARVRVRVCMRIRSRIRTRARIRVCARIRICISIHLRIRMRGRGRACVPSYTGRCVRLDTVASRSGTPFRLPGGRPVTGMPGNKRGVTPRGRPQITPEKRRPAGGQRRPIARTAGAARRCGRSII